MKPSIGWISIAVKPYFARALAYSELIKLFCKSYESDEEAANELGVVLTLHYKGDEPMKRASLKDSYALVLSDLDKAADLLKLEEDYNPATHGALFNTTYFNEYTVHALRARVALYMRKWDDAISSRIQGNRQQRRCPVERKPVCIKRRELLSVHVDQ